MIHNYQFQTKLSETHSEFQFQLNEEDAAKFISFLNDKVIPTGKESRMRLSKEEIQWQLFWKRHPSSELKLMLAHPEERQWVSTVAMSEKQYLDLLEFFKKKENFKLSKLGRVSQFSNFDVEFQFL